MRDGDIVEQGTHLGLLERSGFYADLYNSQFEHVEQDEDAVEEGEGFLMPVLGD
ncbi:MAG: hypothetical protein KC423_10020 [Anaerolineales bacterium]|nr:hypothetical protein [Anaerolineales bacterium]